MFAWPAAAPLPARCPLPLGALQQRALGKAAPVAWRSHRRPVAGVGHAASLCAAAAARDPGGAGAQPAAAGREPPRPDWPREPRGAGQRVRAAGLGVGGEEEARAPERGREPRPGERGGGAFRGRGLSGRGERRGSEAGRPACCLVGWALPGPRAEGRGVARAASSGGGALAPGRLGRGTWPLSLEM